MLKSQDKKFDLILKSFGELMDAGDNMDADRRRRTLEVISNWIAE